MRSIVIFILLFAAATSLMAQVPQAFNYQTVVRNSSGQIIPDQLVSFRISIQQGSAYTDLYVETHQVTTNGFGMANLMIGTGTVVSGDFSAIGWADDITYIQIEIDATGGTIYTMMGTSQLVSVPYAMHAETAGNVSFSDTSATNELQTLSLSGLDLTISNGNTVTLQDNVDDADADPTNELNTAFSLVGSDVQITDAGGTKSADLSGLKVPQTAILLSDIYPNTNLENAGYTMIGKIQVTRSDTSSTAYTWIDDIDLTNAPILLNYSPIWTGTELIIWGGDLSGAYTNTGWKYNPSTDTWTAMSTTNAPSARSLYSAVWTGSVMIVFGGYNGSALNNGAKYDPVANTWSPITGLPSGVYVHSAVWNGTDMLIFGGNDGFSFINSGYIYNLASDSWTSMSLAGIPTPRYLHSAVWTGSGMIIWGGYDGASALSTGAYYTGGVWLPMTAGPGSRFNHSTVWTDTEMIIWAGQSNGVNYFNDGMKYNPVTNSWTTISPTNAPAIRAAHSTVWTGTEMMVWGGTNTTYPNTGGIYNYANDTWTEMSTINAPTGRMKAASFYTNSKMYVWGGYNGSVINTGGVFGKSGFTSSATSEMYLYIKN